VKHEGVLYLCVSLSVCLYILSTLALFLYSKPSWSVITHSNVIYAGFGGYDCSQRTCPYGRDPTLEGSAASDDAEAFVIECQADAGYFTLTVLGMLSLPEGLQT
jgi:hypothetical protein